MTSEPPPASQRDGRFERTVATADDQRLLALEVHRIVQPVVDVAAVFSRHVELAEAPAAADRDDRAQRTDLAPAGEFGDHQPGAAPDFSDRSVTHRDPPGLFFELGEQIFLDVRGDLKLARGCHLLGIRVDRFGLGKVGDRLEAPFGLVNGEPEALRPGFDGRRHACDAGADDQQVQQVRIAVASTLAIALKPGVARNRTHRPGARIERQFEQWDPGQIAGDVKAGHVGGAVGADGR